MTRKTGEGPNRGRTSTATDKDTISDREAQIFFAYHVRSMKESIGWVQHWIQEGIDQGYFSDVEHEVITNNLKSLRWDVDEAFNLYMVHLNSKLPPDHRWPVRGGKAIVKRVKACAADDETAGLLRFIKYDEDEGKSK